HEASWLPFGSHPHITDQSYLVSWNNKQAPKWSAADNQWAYGPVFRSELIANRIKADLAHGHKLTIAQLVQAMDLPSTEDIRAFGAIQTMLPVGGEAPVSSNGFTDGWWGYVSKDLRREFRIGRERGRFSQVYCGNLPHHRFTAKALRRRCRAALRSSLLAALT